MSSSKPKGTSNGRRTANRSNKALPPAAGTNTNSKTALEPLPEILGDSEAPTANTPRPSPSSSVHSRRRGKQKVSLDHKAIETAFFGGEQPLMHVAMGQDDDAYTAFAASNSRQVSPVGEKPAETHRPRSRTANPWRGRGREQGGIFARPSTARLHAARQQQSGDPGSIYVSANAVVASDNSPLSGTNSAGLIAERNSPAGDVAGTASAGSQRRRGHTLEPDLFVASRLEGEGSGKAPKTATGTHFHVSAENANLTKHPARIAAKKSSASSSATTSTVEIDPDASAQQQGQLSRMLVSSGQGGLSSTHASPEAPKVLAGAATTAGGAILGRNKRGSSAGDSRFGQYKGVFGTRIRSGASEQAHSGSPEDHMQKHPQAGSADSPGVLAQTAADDPVEDGTRGAATVSNSTENSPDAARRALPSQLPAVRISKPSTVALTTENVPEPTEPLAKSNESAANVHVQGGLHQHQRRESIHGARDRRAQPVLPSMASLSINGRVTSGSSNGGGGSGGEMQHAETPGMSGGYDVRSASTPGQELRCPWRPDTTQVVPNPNRTLRGMFNRKWTNIAAAPNASPTCAVAGREGLVILNMGPDSITQRSQPSAAVRRWSMALVFKDVIWKPSDYVATGSNDGTVIIWDPSRASDAMVRKYQDISRSINRLAHKPDDPFFIYGAFSDVHLLGWDIRVQNARSTFRIEMQRAPQDISCNPVDANAIAAISSEGQISLWDVRKPTECVKQFHAHSAYNGQCLTWHPKGRFIASGASDQTIKIWDVASVNSSKFNITPFCSIHTVAITTNRLQWRPGHDTQISSSAFSQDSRLQVWDMRNPNHSLMYHDLHSSPIGGFVWVDPDTVWSTARDPQNATEPNVVQCNMQTDAVITAGLLGSTSADFSPASELAVATGAFHPRADAGLPPLQPTRLSPAAKHGGAAARTGAGSGSKLKKLEENPADVLSMVRFQPDLPESFVDEHVLDPSLSSKSAAVCYLAACYRYDPDLLAECCEHNAAAAATIGMVEIAKFWQFLGASFGNVLPLRPRRRQKKAAATAAEEALEAERLLVESQRQAHALHHPALGVAAASVGTSRTSSVMFPSKSVMSELAGVGATEPSSDDEHYFRHTSIRSPLTASRHSSSSSLTRQQNNQHSQLQLQHQLHLHLQAASPAGRLERASLSHTNLQQAALHAKKHQVPSPTGQSTTNSLSGLVNNYVSEPTTPATRQGNREHVFANHTSNHSIASITSSGAHRLPKYVPSSSKKPLLADETPGGSSAVQVADAPPYPGVLSAPSSFINPADNGSADGKRAPAMLSLQDQRHITKAELKLVVDSCAYYADRGDVQTAVTVALLLRNFIRLPQWAAAENWFSCYIDLLDRHKAHHLATEIILASPFDSVKADITSFTYMNLSCNHCGSSLNYITDIGFADCADCQRRVNACAICEQPTRGRFVWCQGCGHGGHAEHINDWFAARKQQMCPAGCGHMCQPLLSANAS
ncbi:SEA (Seh1-associated) complex subunit [Coemansia sp. RSA 1722]|nr:SEA (Seh1-associated) complex subunit [Coemansia sp. RSA 485]KAJ2606754.1 SEA (Seh1-associated) complex subunit [Coemansia sp. RSA 1722]KAJ2639878.1 SEA (Seh1-associated) complex subunit [Coemansia sp. RSA 1286]